MLRVATAELIRPRLVDRFRAAERDRVLLVIAPGGYGKSIALRQYLASISEPTIRFQLRPEHRTLLGFARGFADAFEPAQPGISGTLAEVYGRCHSGSDAGAQVAAWAAEFAGSFDGIVAIDDLHLAQTDPQVVAFLDGLIRACDRARWILCSRSTEGLPVGTWAIRGDMTLPITDHDLCFTIDEAHEVSRVLGDAAGNQGCRRTAGNHARLAHGADLRSAQRDSRRKCSGARIRDTGRHVPLSLGAGV